DHGEIPVEPEHQSEHADDGEEIDEDVERGRRGKTLDRLDVRGDSAKKSASLMGVVVGEREALQMMVGAQAEIVRHPLPDTLGVVIVDVGGERSQQRNDYGCQ